MKKDTRVSHKKGESWVDFHLHQAIKVESHEFFVITDESQNEVAGLLVGTEVRRIGSVDAWPSKYWKGNYYSVLVECPNGETRKIGCDALQPRKTDKHFLRQRRMFKKVLV